MKRLAGTLIFLMGIGSLFASPGIDQALQNGRLAYQAGDYGLAISYYRQYLADAEVRKDEVAAADALRMIGDALRASGEYKDALTQLQAGMERATKANDTVMLGRIHDRIAAVQYEMQDAPKAVMEADIALTYAEAKDDKGTISSSLNILGASYRSLGKNEKALEALSQSIAIQRAMGDTTDVPGALNNIANTLHVAGRHQEAIDTATKSYEMATNLKIPVYQQYASLILNKSYHAMGNYKLAYQWLEIHAGISNLMKDEARGKELAKLMTEMNSAQKEQENKRLLAENALQLQMIDSQQNKAVALALIGLLVLSIAIGLAVVTRRQRRTNADLREKNQRIEQQTQTITQINVELERVAREREAQKSRLEEINHVKDQLFSIISHDLRSPLTSIQGMLMLMEQGLVNEQEAGRMAIALKTRVDNTKILLDNILNWSRSQMEGFTVKPEPIDMSELVEQESQLMVATAANKGLMLENKIPKETIAMGDRDMIALVVRNLISNAMKFTETGGTINVHCRQTPEGLEVAISDTGVGVPAESVQKLFGEKNFSTIGTNQEKGSGIGLRLCNEFVTKNKGRIWMEANGTKGSTFWFALPSKAPEVAMS